MFFLHDNMGWLRQFHISYLCAVLIPDFALVSAESVAGEYSVEEDKLLYLRVPKYMTFEAALAFCRKIPGHRLAMTKTLQQWYAAMEIMESTG